MIVKINVTVARHSKKKIACSYSHAMSPNLKKPPVVTVRNIICTLSQYPFASSLDKLIEEHAKVCQDKPTDIESEKLCCMSSAEFKSYLRFISMPQSRIINLSRNLICQKKLAIRYVKSSYSREATV